MKSYEVSAEGDFSEFTKIEADGASDAARRYSEQEYSRDWSDQIDLHVREEGDEEVYSFRVYISIHIKANVRPLKNK